MSKPQIGINSQYLINQRQVSRKNKRKLQLQGQCKILQTKLYVFSWAKTIFLFIPVILSIVGLLLIKYYKIIRASIFYWQQSNRLKATHIYIKGNGKGEEEIVQLIQKQQKIYFFYKNLKYQLTQNNQKIPVALDYQEQIYKKINKNELFFGLSNEQVQKRRKIYGKNQHIVEPPQYYEYLYDVMTQPFFFLQYLAAVIYIVQKIAQLAVLLVGSSIITTTINYFILYFSYKSIKQIAQKITQVQVIRQNKKIRIPSTQLVPGDIFIPSQQLNCDVVVVRGEMYVNQANLTGQSVPIGKFQLINLKQLQDNSKWAYQGSLILSNQNILLMAIHTGYSTKRGRILRKILNKTSKTPHFFKTCLVFVFFNYLLSIIAYLGTLYWRIERGNLDNVFIGLNFLLLITFCVPPSFPIYFNLVYSFSLIRLKNQNILGTQPQKSIQSTYLETVCFDKTGTLTQDKVQVQNVYKFEDGYFKNITNQQRNCIDYKIFGCCHSVKKFDGVLMGDEVDLKMFIHSNYEINQKKQKQLQHNFSVNYKRQKLKIIKINQYQSKFQSMSVLVKDQSLDKYYIFAKGAPEIIHKYSCRKFQYFDKLLQKVSYGGYRSIGYGYKQIKQTQIQHFIKSERQQYLINIQILGLVVFENKIKHDSRQTIEQLKQAGISSKIITGDNIYIAIQTAIRCGIIDKKQSIIVIQGKNQTKHIVDNYQTSLQPQIHAQTFIFTQKQVIVNKHKLTFKEYISNKSQIVIDNQFLKQQLKAKRSLSQYIKVFTRITPQNKAAIVKSIKYSISAQYSKKTKIQKYFSQQMGKVGMVGDGANDLLAIKQADIGIGIRNCDSSYAASFSIVNLKDIGLIIRQAKCSTRQIMQIVRFVTITAFLSVPSLIIFQTQATYFSPFQLIFGNMTKYLLFNILLALSKPADKQIKYKPCSNFLQLQNLLVFWVNVILGVLSTVAFLILARQQNDYVFNRTRGSVQTGWAIQTSLSSSQYLFYTVQPIVLVFCIFQGSPWKQPIYKNILLFIAIILNAALAICMFFIYPQLSNFFGFANFSQRTLIYLFVIAFIHFLVSIVANQIIQCVQLHKITQKNESVSIDVQISQEHIINS